MFKWKENADPAAKENVLKLFRELPAKIDGFEDIRIYEVTKSTGGFDHVFVLQFSSIKTFQKYENHSDHKKISTIGPPLLADFSEFNYWK